MSFAETFSTLRKRRRLTTTAWESTSSPYVRDIEKKGLIPGREKLDQIASLFVEVARDQGAADPEADARLLRRERERAFLIDRAEFDPELADFYVLVYTLWREELEGEKRDEILEAFSRAVDVFSDLETEQRQEFIVGLRQMAEQFSN